MSRGEEPSGPTAADVEYLRRAIELSRRCPRSMTSYAVGAILIDAEGHELATGFSLELGPGYHAEEAAFEKARNAGRSVVGSTLYSSLEPCSRRLSGKQSCTDRALAAGVRRVVFALREPPLFVRCDGVERLRDAGVDVLCVPSLGPLVEQVNAHLWAGRDERPAGDGAAPDSPR